MTEPSWSQVLLTMYRSEPQKKAGIVDIQLDWSVDALALATDLSDTEIMAGLAKLANWDLVEHREVNEPPPEADSLNIYSLIKDGLEVATDRDVSQRQRGINQSVAAFTLTLVLIGLVSFVSNTVAISGLNIPLQRLLVVLIAAFVVIISTSSDILR